MIETAISAVQRHADIVVGLTLAYIPQAVLAVIVLFVGLKLITFMTRAIDRGLSSEKVDPSLRGFMQSAVGIVLKLLLFLTVASMVGVQTTSFVALIGAIGLAVGLSLQGSLANLAGGILILFFKPYVVGETILAQTQQGTVVRIEMFSTILRGEDGRMIIIPNGVLSNGVIVNMTRKV